MKKIIISLMALVALAACGTRSETGKPAMTRNDKRLSCEDLLLEINDAKFLHDQAEKNKGLNFKNVIWPVGYPETYSSAEEAISNTTARVQYLQNIFNIKKCDDPNTKADESKGEHD